jgi:two-component system cell cycle sensor histidine kinase/response regulator CckA
MAVDMVKSVERYLASDPNADLNAALASIVASSRDAIIGMSRSGQVTSFNPAAAALYGFSTAEMVGRSCDTMIPPAQREREAAILQRLIGGDQVGRYSTERRHRDGGTVAVWVTLSPILDAEGGIVGAAAMSHAMEGDPEGDEAERGRSAGAMAVVLESPMIGPTTPDALSGPVTEPAADLTDTLNLRAQEDQDRFQVRMEAEQAKERVHVQDAQDRFQVRMGVERAKERVQVRDAQDRFQVGMEVERAKERVQVRDAQDRFQVRMGAEHAREREHVQFAQDRVQDGMNAERAEAQSERDHLQAQLQQSQRLEVLGQLAGGVAHDFNNLLAVILNYAAFVAEEIAARPDGELDAAGRDVGQIQRAAERATALTHQLLAFARREVVQPRVIDLNAVVTDVEQLLTRTIGEDVVLNTELTDGLWPVLADTGQVEQVLVNLAVNARDAMVGGGELSIETANVGGGSSQDGRSVRLRISDTGAGMPAGVSDHVFEPFFTTKADGTGTGLGLATVYGIVTQAGGTIRLQSMPGVGTTFTIMLPVTDEVAVPIETRKTYVPTPQGETILVVEDEEALREVTERIFTRSGYHVITAANGLDAVSLAVSHVGEIHLLVTDVVMPHMLGKEVAARIRDIRPGIDVLYMSGYARPVLASQGRLDPHVNLIEKPFTASTLTEAAGKILAARVVPGA